MNFFKSFALRQSGRTLFGIVLLALLTTWLFQQARAYVLSGPRWASNRQIVMYLQVGESNGTLIDGSTSWNQSAEDALARWNVFLGSGVQFAIGTVNPPITAGDGKNSVFWSSTDFGMSFGDALAVTHTHWNTSTNLYSEADVVVNNTLSWNSYRGNLKTAASGGTLHDFHRVILHEFGHALGLSHESVVHPALMYPYESNVDAIQNDDSAGAQAIYGSVSQVETISTPTTPSGPTSGTVGSSFAYTYSTGGASSSSGHSIQYLLDWGDGTSSGWLPVNTTSWSHYWSRTGTFQVKAYARCATHTSIVSSASGTRTMTIGGGVTYTVTPSAGAGGTITPNTPQTVNSGGTLNFYAAPASGFAIDRWFKNGQAIGGLTDGADAVSFTSITSSFNVQVTFKAVRPANIADGSVISLQAFTNGRLVAAEAGGAQPLIANRLSIGPWEQFQVVNFGNGVIALKSLANGKFVCAENAGQLPLIANRVTPGTWEQFQTVDQGNGTFALIAKANGKYVCAENGGASSLIANRSSVGGWELFRVVYPQSIKPVTVTASLQAGSSGMYVCAENAGAGSLVANRPLLGQWEQFQFHDLGNGNVAIRARTNNRFVAAENAGASPLIANRTVVGAWEQFQLLDVGGGFVALRALANGLYVSSANSGSVLIAKSAYVGTTERFVLNVSLIAVANGALVSGGNPNTQLIANRSVIGIWEQFQIVNTGNGYVAFKAKGNGLYVCAENAGSNPLTANRATIGGWEQFQWIVGGNGNIVLKALTNGLFVTAEDAGNSPLIANRAAAQGWEQFR